jgi:hypothetical protein
LVIAFPTPLLPPATPDPTSLQKLQVRQCLLHIICLPLSFLFLINVCHCTRIFTRRQQLDAAIALAESNAHPSDEDNDRLLSLYSEQRNLRSAIQALMEKETVGGPATISFSHRVLHSAEEILVLGRGVDVADVVLDAFGPAGRGNGPARTAVSQVGAAHPFRLLAFICGNIAHS